MIFKRRLIQNFSISLFLDSTSSQSDARKDELMDRISHENPDESLEREVPEITLVEQSYDLTKSKVESRQCFSPMFISEKNIKISFSHSE